jgi:hypothetical protein
VGGWKDTLVRLARSRCPSRPCVGQRFGTGVVDTSLESCDTSRRFGIFATARCQYRLINGVRTFSGRVPYLESNEHDNPTGQPVSMADLGESIHESSGPSRNCPELRIHLATGARTGRERLSLAVPTICLWIAFPRTCHLPNRHCRLPLAQRSAREKRRGVLATSCLRAARLATQEGNSCI